jgi:hypothetical protein
MHTLATRAVTEAFTPGYNYAKAGVMPTSTRPPSVSTVAPFTESSMSFMTPPNPTDLSTLRNRGAKSRSSPAR